MSTVIFDIDGCVADDRHRLHLLPRYAQYHASAGDDKPMNVDVVRKHIQAGHEIVFLTSRPEFVRGITERWLHDVLRVERYRLIMRDDYNQSSSPAHKRRHALNLMKRGPVVAAYDDREDVLEAYASLGIGNVTRLTYPPTHAEQANTVDELLRQMAETYKARNAVYKDNYLCVGEIMKVLFPDGAPPKLLHSPVFHLFELKLVKLTRFAKSGFTHADSMIDDAVYSAMIVSTMEDRP